MSHGDVKSIDMRAELIQHLKALADLEYQRRVWLMQASPTPQHDEFDYAVHFLYDDTRLAVDARSTIGWILRSETEAEAISKVVASLEAIFQKYGTELSDEDYIHLPEWASVLETAAAALSELQR